MNCPKCGSATETSPVEGKSMMLDGSNPNFRGTYTKCAANCGWSSIRFEPSMKLPPACELVKP